MYVSVSVYALVFVCLCVCLCVCLLSVSLCLCMRCAQEQDARHGVDASGSSQSSALCPGALVQMALQCKLQSKSVVLLCLLRLAFTGSVLYLHTCRNTIEQGQTAQGTHVQHYYRIGADTCQVRAVSSRQARVSTQIRPIPAKDGPLGHYWDIIGTYVKDGPYLLELPLISKIRHVRAATYNGTLVINIDEGKHITYTGNTYLER